VGIAVSYLKQAPHQRSSKPLPLTRVILGRCPKPPKRFFASENEWLGEEEEWADHLCYSRPYSASPTVRAAGKINCPYREHCKGGSLPGCLPSHCKSGSNVSRPYSVGGALLLSFSRSDILCGEIFLI